MSSQTEAREKTILKSVNPATGETVDTFKGMSDDEVAACVEEAHTQFLAWRRTEYSLRAERLNRMAELLEEGKENLASLATREMGKTHKEGVGEVEKCAWVCRYYAEKAEDFLADETVETDREKSLITCQPIGVVLAIMPWNFPYWQVFRFLAPALMAGNGALLKHASNVSGCALAIENIFLKAGFPAGLFRTLLIPSKQVEKVLENPLVRAATLTGSTGAGKAVAAKAGEHIKKTVLELGGSDPYLVLADADLDLAAEQCAKGRLINSGQSCIAAKRFIVVADVHDEFVEKFKAVLASKKMGDPTDPDSDIGPQVNREARDELHKQVEDSVAKGARCLLGGQVPDGPGAFYPPTLLTEVVEGMPAYSEELFGPVAVVIKAKDEAHAVEIANDSEFGLGGGIFTRDIEKGLKLAREAIDTGAVTINGLTASDPRMPFGGVKMSGYGRELSRFGIREFVNIKAVGVSKSK